MPARALTRTDWDGAEVGTAMPLGLPQNNISQWAATGRDPEKHNTAEAKCVLVFWEDVLVGGAGIGS
ncbi:hypothetical protein NDU88_008903 [Pleurodeles waltl]|uniref:Uncharacterized protein n=1 Tax=Pleurodeles waltl TaxID=8319 RepID=A0AAV7P0P1_PLEWA|nr:hypothetical protein NDU88_008903 [Pleurodeles waltl]